MENTQQIQALKERIEHNPAQVGLRLQLAQALRENGDLTAAEKTLAELVTLAPLRGEHRFELAKTQFDLGMHINCLLNTRKLTRSLPDQAGVWLLQGLALSHLQANPEAIEALEKALELDENSELTMLQLSLTQLQDCRYDDAVESLKHLLQCNPTQTDARVMLAQAALMSQQYDLATATLQELSDQGHENVRTLTYSGMCYMRTGELDPSVAALRRAIVEDADNAEAHYRLGEALLMSGEYAEGWKEYAYRQHTEIPMVTPPGSHVPLWQGESLEDKELIVTCEQGVGENVQLARVFPLLKARTGARQLTFICTADFSGLFRGTPGIDTLVESRRAFAGADFYCSLLDVMALLGINVTDLQVPTPYLKINDRTLAHWNQWLQQFDSEPPRIGICWSGSELHQNNHLRSIPLEQLSPLFDLDNMTWISLQHQRSHELRAAGLQEKMVDPMADVRSFTDTAALISHMDLVISVDTAVAHIAGALNKPVWTLLPKSADWRYLSSADKTPWYPSMRLLRAPQHRDWSGLLEQLDKALTTHYSGQ